MFKNINVISYYTFREALSRKIFMSFFIITGLILLLFGVLLFGTDVNFVTNIQFDGGNMPEDLGIISSIKMGLVMPLYWGGLFLAIFSASSFIPNMLEKGNIDFLLSKPISRTEIILGKFLGGIITALINTAFLIIGIWLLIGLKFNDWDLLFLSLAPMITFVFALFYSLMILFGILTQSNVIAMIVSYLVFFVFSPLLTSRHFLYDLNESFYIKAILEPLYYIIPQSSELGDVIVDISAGVEIAYADPIYVSVLYIILTLAGSIFIFNKKDY